VENGTMNPSLTQRLVKLLDRRIDDNERHRASLHLLDWIGCAVLGATSDPGKALLKYGKDQPSGPCVALGAGFRDANSASFVNGGLGNIYELDDLHRTSIMHAGDVVIPTALSATQRDNANGRALLNAIVKGYEVAIRIGIAVSGEGYSPWYNSSTCGVFGAASAAASIFKLGPVAHVDALGQAGMQAAGLWQCRLEPTYSKQLSSARAAQSGLIAADIARYDFPAPRFILEGELGFLNTYYPRASHEAVVAAPQGNWKIHEVSFKPWPACRHTHAVIEAGIILGKQRTYENITSIAVTTYQAAIEFCDNPNPKTEHEAQFSLQHCLAAAIINGDIELSDISFIERDAPKITDLRSKISVAAKDAFTNTFPSNYGAEVEVIYVDGHIQKVRIETAKGDPENPLAEDEIFAKFDKCLGAAGVSKKHVIDLETVVKNIDQEANTHALSAALLEISTDIDMQIHKNR
jgi:2-methylcitrate dehydratase PrpD